MNRFFYEEDHVSVKKIAIVGMSAVCIVCIVSMLLILLHSSRNLIYCDLDVKSKSTYITEKLRPSSEYGEHLRLWFENEGEETVKVTLAKCSVGGYDNMMIFSVGAGKSLSKEYYNDRLGRQKYVVILKSEENAVGSVDMINGNLKIRQY